MISNKKILTILGTRPEIIRLSLIMKKLDDLCNHKVLHTGQNYDPKLNDIFFEDMGLRSPDIILDVKGVSLAKQLGVMMEGVENTLKEFKPDAVLILGDTNSGLMAVICEKMGVPVFHMEAGNRCYDLKVPEEKNRRVIDHISSYNLPYTPGSRENLLNEGLPATKIFECGNPIYEVLEYYKDTVELSEILETKKLKPGCYTLVTSHRAENVDNPTRLANIFAALEVIADLTPVIFSCHPRTRNMLQKFDIKVTHPAIDICDPFGFFDFIKLEKNARTVITDSGTCQEEACIFHVPAVTIRETTERPETVKCGSNIVSGLETANILSCYKIMHLRRTKWARPIGYCDDHVADNVIQYILGEN